MATSMRDLIDNVAEEDSEDDESFQGEDEDGDINGEGQTNGEGRSEKKKERREMDDSSEEDDDDDDEEAIRQVNEGFIDDEEEEAPETAEERHARKKRRRVEREEEAQLEEDDLDLIHETHGSREDREMPTQKFKRLKRRDENDRSTGRGLEDMFNDEEEDAGYGRNRAAQDDLDDFIEDDYPAEDEEDVRRQQEDLEVARGRDRGIIGNVVDTTGLDKDALEDMEAIFGNGDDYEWALQMEDEEEQEEMANESIQLKDVFEPSQLTEKMLTDEDNQIRAIDEPERFQLERRPFRTDTADPQDIREETKWIVNLMWPRKGLKSDLHTPFTKAVNKVLEFFIVDSVEVPYVFQHRKDYLIHAQKIKNLDWEPEDPESPEFSVQGDKLLSQDDLWKILEYDIKFRGLLEKRGSIRKMINTLKSVDVEDEMLEGLLIDAVSMEELQDLQDYVTFQYSAQLKDAAAMDAVVKEVKRPGAGARTTQFDRIRRSRAYGFVKAYGITPDGLARNALRESKKSFPEDPSDMPLDLADSLTDGDFATGDGVIHAARQMYAEELLQNPRMRKHFRLAFYQDGVISSIRTEKGLRMIDEAHPYFEIKYLKDQMLYDLARRPELFLKMMRAEEDGLVEVKVKMQDESGFKKQLYAEFASDNFSSMADAWNEERHKVLDVAFVKMSKVIAKGVKDNLRTECQEAVLKICREEYLRRIDQAPYKPKGMIPGTTPRVLAISNGMDDPNREKSAWAWVEEEGRVLEHGRAGNLARDEESRQQFADLIQRRTPDVILVSGWSADTNRLGKDVENLVQEKDLRGPEYRDADTDEPRSDLLEVVIVNDETARLYKDSPRAIRDHPSLSSMTRYCVGLAKYAQSPLKEYAALGKDIVSLAFHPVQHLLPQDKLMRYLDTAMVDIVNLCGVDINEAVQDPYVANLLPYVAGLGPRKASAVIKGINMNGGVVNAREELVGDPDSGKVSVVGPKVWDNCASFLIIEYDPTSSLSEPLDNTRVHPEDYELGRKMAADALDLDEEDVKAEVDENGPGAVVRKLFKEEEQDKVNELVLEEYAEQLQQNFNQRKRATLESIRAELQVPYEELRRPFGRLSSDEIFIMFTGETQDSLAEGMIVPVNVRVVKDDFAIVKLDCGIEGRIEAGEVNYRSSVKDALSQGQVTQAKIMELNRRDFLARLSVREDVLRRPYKRPFEHSSRTWDYDLEDRDREELREKDKVTGRTQRVINHPLFKPFNSTQAEQYLGSQAPGEVVIRPSSKGNDHLAVTWKVADGVYQHIDVLELHKDTEFSVGKTLRIGSTNYSDLDELIVEHVKGMARMASQMMQHEKFQKGSREQLEKWLTTYMDANPNRSSYAFCLDQKHPGYFWLCFKASRQSKVNSWPVRLLPGAFEFLKNKYPDTRALSNGFKLLYQTEISRMQANGGR